MCPSPNIQMTVDGETLEAAFSFVVLLHLEKPDSVLPPETQPHTSRFPIRQADFVGNLIQKHTFVCALTSPNVAIFSETQTCVICV